MMGSISMLFPTLRYKESAMDQGRLLGETAHSHIATASRTATVYFFAMDMFSTSIVTPIPRSRSEFILRCSPRGPPNN